MRTHALLVRLLVAVAILSAVALRAQEGSPAPVPSAPQTPTARTPPRPRSVPEFEVEKGWPAIPEKWKLGDASSVAIDAQDNVWILSRPRTLLKPTEGGMAAPPVVVLDASGKFVKAWGGAQAGAQWPEREHGIHVDAKGFVWITGNNCPTSGAAGLRPVSDDQILKLTGDGQVAMRIGASNDSKGNADTRNVHRAADVWVHAATNELYVADGYGNHRVIVFNAETGAYLRMWGAFGRKPVDDDHCEIVTPTTLPPGQGSPNFSTVHAIRVAKDGMVYVADRENRRVQAFTPNGTFMKQVIKADTAFARNLAFSADPVQQFLYVGDGQEIAIVDRQSLEIVGAVKVPGMIGGGHHLATDSKGNLYIAQTAAGLQKLTFKGMSSPLGPPTAKP